MPVSPIPVIAAHSMLVFLLQVGLLLSLALALGSLAARFGLPALVGELAAGVVVGPSLLGHVLPGFSGWLLPHDPNQLHLLDAVGQIGVIMLVGITGIHLDLGQLRKQGATAARVSIGGLLVPLGLGIGLGYLVPAAMLAHGAHRTVFALFLGVAMCVSAIPVIAKTLLEMRLLHRDIGQLIMGSAAVSDSVGWLLLAVVSALATTGVRAGQVGLSIGYLVGLVLLAAVAGRPIVGGILRVASRGEEPRGTLAATAALLLLFAAATQAMGFEAILGAFVGGVLIGQVPGLDLAKLAPLRTFTMAVLAPVFFATVGLRMDLATLREPAVLETAILVLAIAIIGKFAGAYLGARSSKLTHWEGLALGAGLNSRGVVEVIVAMAGLRLGVLNTATYTVIVLTAVATSVMAPPLLRMAASRIAPTPAEFLRDARMSVMEPSASASASTSDLSATAEPVEA